MSGGVTGRLLCKVLECFFTREFGSLIGFILEFTQQLFPQAIFVF